MCAYKKKKKVKKKEEEENDVELLRLFAIIRASQVEGNIRDEARKQREHRK